MKSTKMMTQVVAGVFCCLTVTALYAVCVTSRQLTDGAAATVGQAPFTSEVDFVYSILNGKGSFRGLSPAVATSLGATGDASAVLGRLSASPDWKAIPAVPYANAAAPTEAEKENLQKTLIKVQNMWANYGEIVIAVDQNHIAILVPGNTTTDAGALTTTTWGQLNAPNIAYAGVSGVGGFPGKAKEMMSVPFSDPSKVAFFRYKN